jgi:hypothetical protein
VPGEHEHRRAGDARIPRRVTDVVEDAVAWLLTAASLLLVALALATGVGAHDRAAERARTEAMQLTTVTATLLEPTPGVVSESGYRPPVDVQARWIGPDGVPRTGRVPVVGAAAAGSDVTVWLDRDGAVTWRSSGIEAVASGVVSGIGVLFVGGVVLVVVWLLVRRAIGAINARRWAREWAVVGPEWTARR